MVHAGKTERGARTPKLLHSAMHISPGIHVHRGTEVYTTEPELRDPSGQEGGGGGGMHAHGVRARSLDPYLLGSVFGSILCSDISLYRRMACMGVAGNGCCLAIVHAHILKTI